MRVLFCLNLMIILMIGLGIGCGDLKNLDNESWSIDAQPPAPAEPCAIDLDADLDPNSAVNQVTGGVAPDLGQVPQGPEFTGDPADQGPYHVFKEQVVIPIEAGTLEGAGMVIEISQGTIPGTFYLPSQDGGQTTADGQHPVVIVLPGFTVGHKMYNKYSKHFASHGFCVLGITTRANAVTAVHDQEAFEIVQTIDWLASAHNPYRDHMDLTKVAVAGHSKGGKLGFLAAALDQRIDMVIGWDPSNSGGPPCFIPLPLGCNRLPVAPNCEAEHAGVEHYMQAETIVLGMPRDNLLNPDRHHNSIHFYRGAPPPATLVFFKAGHIGPLMDRTIIKLTKQVQMAMLLQRFKGMTGMDRYLPTHPTGAAELEQKCRVIRVETK